MKVELKLAVDPRTNHFFWDGRLVNGKDTIIQVVSKTFHPQAPDTLFGRRFQVVCDRLIDEINLSKDKKAVRQMLLNN
jgi:hypothetical protein